jgi:hypothetical protein
MSDLYAVNDMEVVADPEPVEYLPYLCWITTKAENLPYLESLGVEVGKYTGTQYQGCRVPAYAVADMMDNWGELMFGNEEDDTSGPEHFVKTVLQYKGPKSIPLLVQMGFMKPPAARKVK